MTDGDFGSQAGGIGIGQQQNDRHIQQAVDRLLSKLLAFMAAYPIRADEAMPEHSVAWMTGIAKGPGKIIGDAMAITPVLWLSALPEGVVIVKRDLLERCGIGKELIDLAQMKAMAVVTSVAGRLQQEDIEAESSAGDMIAAEVDALEPGKQ